jgi:hypothetical protein
MNSKQRKLKFIQFKNKLTKLAKGKVRLDRTFKFIGEIGRTRDGRVIFQHGTTVFVYDAPAPRFDMSSMFPESTYTKRRFEVKIDPSKFIVVKEPLYIDNIEVSGRVE